MEEVKRLAHQPIYGLENDLDLSLAIQVLHNIGYLLYFPPSSLEESNIIILDPQWLVNILKSIVTVKEAAGMEDAFLTMKHLWRVFGLNAIHQCIHLFLDYFTDSE